VRVGRCEIVESGVEIRLFDFGEGAALQRCNAHRDMGSQRFELQLILPVAELKSNVSGWHCKSPAIHRQK
jgi:hypothetical protein